MGMFMTYTPKVTCLTPAFHQVFARKAKPEENFCMDATVLVYIFCIFFKALLPHIISLS
jgi:hypothetical protein